VRPSLSAIAFVVTTLLAGLTAILLGATAGPGAWAVAVVFGLSFAASVALNILSRPRPI
jgi:hypothetical protein